MRSLDTNILLYATNKDCREYDRAREVVEAALDDPGDCLIADQVYFELYRLLRNPNVLQTPLSAGQAAAVLRYYRDRSGWLHCAWEASYMGALLPVLDHDAFPARATFDAVLAVTLKMNEVTHFYTRNVSDFVPFGFFQTSNPID